MSPELSRFHGIRICMYADDHNPPHFHVEHSGEEAEIRISTLEVLAGSLDRKSLDRALLWAERHQDELADNWFSIADTGTFEKIPPLGEDE